MKIYVVIPAHNEETTLGKTLLSLTNQTKVPDKLVVVNDNSSDNTASIIKDFEQKCPWIEGIHIASTNEHVPGSKVINAFYAGFESLDSDFDIICKFDADLIFPENYIETIGQIFNKDPKVGVAGGLPYIEKDGEWRFEAIASKNHVRGPLKAYRKDCFHEIGGLKRSIGWDSVDVLLAQYHGWTVKTNHSLQVKHLKPTGAHYNEKSKFLQGEALYKMRFGILLCFIASLKGGINRRSADFFLNGMKGYLKAKRSGLEFLVDADQGRFIRKLRWRNIRKKLLNQKN